MRWVDDQRRIKDKKGVRKKLKSGNGREWKEARRRVDQNQNQNRNQNQNTVLQVVFVELKY